MEEITSMPRPMEPVTPQIGIDTIRRELEKELKSAAQSFIRIGYLLRVTKDTNTLYGSGYKDIYDFALSEFGLDKSQVSRFMRINERFSEGGYSDRLMERYENFGSSKLAEMLLLPEAVAEELPPEVSKAEIRAVVEEIQEEQKITDIEVALEPKAVDPDEPLVCTAFREYFREKPDEYVSLAESLKEPGGKDVDKLLDVLAPSGISMKMVRVAGVGRVMVSLKGAKEPVTVTNVRQNEKESMSLSDMVQKIAPLLENVIVKGYPARVAWELLYGMSYPAEEEPEERREENAAEKKDPKEGQKSAQDEQESAQDEQEDVRKGKKTPANGNKPGKKEKKPAKVVDFVKPKKAEEKVVPEPEKADEAPVPWINPPEPAEEEIGETAKDVIQCGAGEPVEEKGIVAPEQPGLQDSLRREAVRLHAAAGEAMCAKSWKMCLRHLDNMRDAVRRLIDLDEEEREPRQMSVEDYPELVP